MTNKVLNRDNTQLAVQTIANDLRFIDRPELGELVAEEQSAADEMWKYLNKRDAEPQR